MLLFVQHNLTQLMLFISQPPLPPTPQKSLRICENPMGAFFESGWVWTHPNPPVTPPLFGPFWNPKYATGRKGAVYRRQRGDAVMK